jgi:hypothetical protein
MRRKLLALGMNMSKMAKPEGISYWNASSAAILRGASAPTQLQHLQEAMIYQIRSLRREISNAYRNDKFPHLQEHLFADSPTTLVIMGERGTGKSTLLVSLIAELMREGIDLVLPIMRPELFGDNDSVVSSFLASLWGRLSPPIAEGIEASAVGTLGTERADAGDIRVNTEILRLLAETARAQATSSTTLAALENATDGPVDFAQDSISVSRSRVRLSRQITRLTKELCLPGGGQSDRLIIVPIDDPDLAPSHVRQILKDLRVLGSVPGIVPVACLCSGDLAAAWNNDAEARWGQVDARRAAHNFEQEILKIFPFRSRFILEPPTARQRLAFAPVTRTDSLAVKIRELRSAVETSQGVKWPVDEALTYAIPKFGIPNPLPDNPRSLLQLWESLDTLTTSGTSVPWTTIITLRRMLDLLSERVRTWSAPSRKSSLYEIGGEFTGDDGPDRQFRHEITISLDNFRLGISASGSFEPESPDPARSHSPRTEPLGNILLRPLHAVRASMIRPRTSPAGAGSQIARNEASELDDLPPSEIASLLAIQEVAHGSGAFRVYGDTLFLGQAEWRFLQKVTLGRLATDDIFVLMPEATTLAEILRAATLWNELVKHSKETISTDQLLATAISAACAFAECETSLYRPVDYETALKSATRVYLQNRGLFNSTSSAFCDWYERDLPFQWHTAFFNGERIRAFSSRHHETVTGRAVSSETAMEPVVAFDARLKRIVDGIDEPHVAEERCWVSGYFDVAATLGSRWLSELGALDTRWRDRCTSLHAGTVTGGLISKGSGMRRMAPYPTPKGQELLEAALDMLRRQRDVLQRSPARSRK